MHACAGTDSLVAVRVVSYSTFDNLGNDGASGTGGCVMESMSSRFVDR